MTRIFHRLPPRLAVAFAIVLLGALATRSAVAGPAGSIVVESVDQDGTLLPGGCYAVEGPDYPGPICDNNDGDADPEPGLVEFQDLLPGDWLVSELQAPDGYRPASDLVVSLKPGATVLIVFEHVLNEEDVDSNDPDIEYEAQPPDPPYEPVEVTPPARLDLTPTCGGVKATIVAATGAAGAPTKIVGTNGNDVIVGTAGPDLIAGLGGHDRICSLDGADEIAAGEGDDWVDAGPGDDILAGQAGVDSLAGGAGKRDQCDGGTEQDIATGCEATFAIP